MQTARFLLIKTLNYFKTNFICFVFLTSFYSIYYFYYCTNGKQFGSVNSN